MSTIKCVPKHILVEPRAKDLNNHSEVTNSGIHVVYANRNPGRNVIGEVIAVGSDITDISVGDTVIYYKPAGVPLQVNDTLYHRVRHIDIEALINE